MKCEHVNDIYLMNTFAKYSTKLNVHLYGFFRKYAQHVGKKIKCTMVPGDGIGPEILQAVEEIFSALEIPVLFEKIIYSNIAASQHSIEDVMESIKKNRIGLVGTLGKVSTTPYGLISIPNIVLRQNLDLYANVVHAKSLPGIKTKHKNIDVYVIREHTEGEYSALEQNVVKGVVECLKITTRVKSKRIAKFAFDFALKHQRKQVTAVHKANIIKLGDGLFLSSCKEISKMYPRIKFDSMIIDNATMQMTSKPQQFDILVMQNLYGSILDNISSGITGGAGITPGASYSPYYAIFQPGARHTYSDAKGKNIVNPIAMILSSVAMLNHVNLQTIASILENAVLKVLEEGKVRTPDIGGTSSTSEVTTEIVKTAKALLKK